MKILIIEDEPSLMSFIEKGLIQSGYAIETANNGTKGLELAASGSFDLILLDIMLPGMSGFDVIKNLRSLEVNTPIFIMSALTSTDQVVKALDLGAVDYIKKPFDWDELLARIRVVQKKTMGVSNDLTIEDLTIDIIGRKVKRNNKEIRLTAKEYLLLEYLARNANRVVSKNQIMERVWDLDFDTGSNIVEVHIYQLRQKIDKGFETPLIETVIGLGYMLKGEVKK